MRNEQVPSILVSIKAAEGKRLTLTLGALATVADLKAKVLVAVGLAHELYYLTFGGKVLDSGLLNDNGV